MDYCVRAMKVRLFHHLLFRLHPVMRRWEATFVGKCLDEPVPQERFTTDDLYFAHRMAGLSSAGGRVDAHACSNKAADKPATNREGCDAVKFCDARCMPEFQHSILMS
jgi:hypothetical protein